MNPSAFLSFIRQCLNISLLLFFIAYAGQWLSTPVLKRLDSLAYDLRLRATLPNTQDERIVIIDIDEKSLAQQGQWPWPRDTIAHLVDLLFDRYQIDLLAFDILFSEPDSHSVLPVLQQLAAHELANDSLYQNSLKSLKLQLDYDDLLAASFKNRPVVLSFFTHHQAEPINPNQALPSPLASLENASFAALLPKANSYGANLRRLQQNAGDAGFFNNPLVDDDGVFRRVPLLTVYDNQAYESLALAIYRTYLGLPNVSWVLNSDYDNQLSYLEGIRILDYTIPTDEHGAILVPYRGRQKSFRYYSAGDILHGDVETKALQHKIVLIGTTAAGLMDMRSTPIQNVYPGVEIHANIVSGLLDRNIKSKPNYIQGLEIIELLLIGAISVLCFSLLPPLGYAVSFLLTFLAIIYGNFYLWSTLNTDSSLASPLLLLCLLFANQFVFGFLLESRRKKYLSKIFGLYIPAELVEQMARSNQHFGLIGESREMTVFFSDIRGFSTFSEKLEPHELSELINAVLSPVTKVIHDHHGTIDKYIGDAVMSFWGAPLQDPKHAYHAISAALAVLPALKTINAKFAVRGWPEVKMGIGINTGKMSVGNMGSDFRMAYTVMGDAVNLGSRLEGLTKQYGVSIIVSESSKEQAPEFVYRELDRVTVKGKSIPVTIYEPLGLSSAIESNLLEQLSRLDEALHLYRERDWDKAEPAFQQLADDAPNNVLYNLYLKRIAYFKTNPPPDDWNGVFEHTSK